MFYFLMAVALLANLWMIWRVRKMKRHDGVLYRYCELRRQAMQYLRDEDKLSQLPRQDYIALRKMICMMNITIEQYKNHKLVMFNLREFVKYFRAYASANKKAAAITIIDNKEIEDLRKGLMKALFFGFMTYTPFIRSEIVVRLTIMILSFLAKAGIRKVNAYVASLKEIQELSHRYAC